MMGEGEVFAVAKMAGECRMARGTGRALAAQAVAIDLDTLDTAVDAQRIAGVQAVRRPVVRGLRARTVSSAASACSSAIESMPPLSATQTGAVAIGDSGGAGVMRGC